MRSIRETARRMAGFGAVLWCGLGAGMAQAEVDCEAMRGNLTRAVEFLDPLAEDYGVFSAGIQSVPKGQISAASALGMTYSQAMRLVVLPQAFRNMVPLLLTQGIILFQDTSLVYVSALADFFGAAYKVGDRDGRLVEMLLFAGAVYFVICFSASLLVKRLQKKYSTA